MVWSVAGPREEPGGPPPYFKTKPWPEGAPFFENRPPPPHLFKGLDDRPPTPPLILRCQDPARLVALKGDC